MSTFKKLLVVVSLAVMAAPPVHAFLAGSEMSDSIVLAYAALFPFGFMIVSIAGIIAASVSDIAIRSKGIATFRWRPGKAHLTGLNEEKKGLSPEDIKD